MTTQTLHLIDEYLMQGGYTPGIDAETLEREAHLVAAAPDLLAAMQRIVECAGEGDLKRLAVTVAWLGGNALDKAKGN